MSQSPFTVVGAAEYDADADSLTPLEEPSRWESAGKIVPGDEHYLREYRDTL